MKHYYTLLFVLVLLFFSQYCLAQYAPVQYFRLSEREANLMYYQSKNAPDSSFFHTPITLKEAQKEAGHYLQVNLNGEQAEVSLHSTTPVQIQLLNNGYDLSFLVKDTLGKAIDPIQVFLDKKALKFDAKVNCYHIKKASRNVLLEVKTASHNAYFQLHAPQGKIPSLRRTYQRWTSTSLGYWLTLPIRIVEEPFRYVSRGIRYHRWNVPWKRWIPWRKRYTKLQGYIALSQPMYRPGDTLKLKAYVCQPNGKPRQKALTLFCIQGGKTIIERKITATSPGNYQFNQVLGDTLSIDQEYFLELSPDQDRIDGLKHRFRLEDYELDEVEYSLKTSATTLQRGKKCLISLKAQTTNQLPVPDAQAELILLSDQVKQFHAKHILLPDTLWRSKESLGARGEWGVFLPDSLIPAVSLNLRLKVFFNNSSGQLVLKEQKLTFQHAPDSTQVKPDSAQIYLNGSRSADSVWLQVHNPARTTVWFQIRTRDGLVQQGFFQDSLWIWQKRDHSADAYFLSCQHQTKGKFVQLHEEYRHYPKAMQVNLEGPQRVFPGEEANYHIKVQRGNGRPAKGVDLSAGAINAQFGTKNSFTAPNIGYQQQAKPVEFPLYRSVKAQGNYKFDLNRSWVKTFNLQDSLYYQYRYTQALLSTWHDTTSKKDEFYHTVAEFAPFLVKGGKMQAIYLIYVNRKLVYYYNSKAEKPYSFAGLAGYNQIVIRGRDSEYVLDSVFLNAGEKLELVLNEDFWTQNNGQKIKKTLQPSYFTPQEKSLVNQSVFVLRKPRNYGIAYVWDKPENIHVAWYPGENYQVGPFEPKSTLKFYDRDYGTYSVYFEPGFSYDLANENRERLYAYQVLSDSIKQLPTQVPHPQLRERLISPNGLNPQYTYVYDPLEWLDRLYSGKDTRSKRSFQFQYPDDYQLPDSVKLRCVVLTRGNYGANWVVSAHDRFFTYLMPGDYELFLFNRQMKVARRKIMIRQDTLLFEDLSGLSFHQEDSLYSIFLNHGAQSIQAYPKRPTGILYSSARGFVRSVEGRILSDDGEPLIGASVWIAGTSLGTVSDLDGYFELKVPSHDFKLVFSYVGFKEETRTLPPGQQLLRLDVTMQEHISYLSEVVVMAYGTSSSLSSSGSIISVSSSSFSGKISGVGSSLALPSVSKLALPSSTTAELEEAFSDTVLLGPGLRKNFRDHAFWQPALRSNRQGEAFFKAKFPDDITNWKTFVLAADKNQQAGLYQGSTRSYLPLMAQLNVPRFLIHGDQTTLNGKVLNYSGDTLALRTIFLVNNESIFTKNHLVREGIVDQNLFKAPLIGDSLAFAYQLETQRGFKDSEQRSIPLKPIGTLENNGDFWVLDRDTTLHFEGKKGTIHFRAEPNALSLLLEDIKYLRDYPYYCNEQIASKLIGLLAEKQIRKRLQQPFTSEKMISDLLTRLVKSQNPDGSWSWWSGGNPDARMSSYVVAALVQAQQEGYRSVALENGLRWLTQSWRTQKGSTRLRSLQTLILAGQRIDTVGLRDTLARSNGYLADHLLGLWIQQKTGMKVSLRSLDENRSTDIYGGIFWEEKPTWKWENDWYNNRLANTILAYQIAKNAGLKEEMRRIRIHLLAHRGYIYNGLRSRYGWRNTLEVAAVLKNILPDMLENQAAQIGKLQLSGALQGEVNTTALEATFDANQSLTLKVNGTGPFFCTAYQQNWNSDPAPKADLFAVKSHLESNEERVQQLQFGQAAQLVVEIEVKQESQYVMIEIPIPAGCSYYQKPQTYRSLEVHREYFADKVSIFCTRLTAGKQRFTVDLEPRFTGTYTLNPVRVEEMYFPVLYGRNGVEKVSIKP